MDERTKGAWLIHHTNKIERFQGTDGFDNVYTAGKCGKLLSAITNSDAEAEIASEKLRILASACKINPLEQKGILEELKKQKLIDIDSAGNVVALGVTQTSLLKHTNKLFEDSNPNEIQRASISLSEHVSLAPMQESALKEQLGDEHKISSKDIDKLFRSVEDFNIVDYEILGTEKLLFNGNLFRKSELKKTGKVLESLNSAEARKVQEMATLFDIDPCIPIETAYTVLTEKLFKKLQSIGFYDVSCISNDNEAKYFVTRPSSFAKFGDGIVEDALDLAKALVSSLTYGMKHSTSYRGQITQLDALMSSLLSGRKIGSATAIGQDYKALEFKGVVEITKDADRPGSGRFFMRLKKKDVGILAQEVLKRGNAVESVVFSKLNSAAHEYSSPEENRQELREKMTHKEDKISVAEKLDILRN